MHTADIEHALSFLEDPGVTVLKYSTLPHGEILPLKLAAHVPAADAVEQKGAQRRPRILCLHGNRQSAQSLRVLTASLRKCINWVDFDFMHAPHKCTSSTVFTYPEDRLHAVHAPKEEAGLFEWWSSSDAEPTSAKVVYVGIDESISCVLGHIALNGPYDGVLAFSQGATMAALISLLSHEDSLPWHFAVLIAGFEPADETVLAKIPSSPSALPTMHVSGATDLSVPKAQTVLLASRFCSPEMYEHPGGYSIPRNGQFRTVLKKFVATHSR
jgi:predicted esterase